MEEVKKEYKGKIISEFRTIKCPQNIFVRKERENVYDNLQ